MLTGQMCLFRYCFNPRAREGRDATWATVVHHANEFQSTRPRGARRQSHLRSHQDQARFNPRAREGRDAGIFEQNNSGWVSIHAPARGATSTGVRQSPIISCFNPRAREGRDQVLEADVLDEGLFQSTRPRGARRCVPARWKSATTGFNPRAREGRDLGIRRLKMDYIRFNPRAREGRDPIPPGRLHRRCRFNPRAREGRDLALDSFTLAISCFNPRAREGRDASLSRTSIPLPSFNPRAREGRDKDNVRI